MKEINIVACSYTIEPSELIRKISKLEKKIKFKAKGIIVSNNKKVFTKVSGRWEIIKGSNDCLDFSAYDEGAKYLLKSSNKTSENIIFLNDTLFTKHNASGIFRSIVKLLPLLDNIKEPSIIGRGSKYHSVCHANPWSKLNIFIPSYCFALNGQGLKVLDNLDEFLNQDGFMGDFLDESFLQNLHPSFYNLILTSLYSKNSPYKWDSEEHSRTRDLLNKKARCMYFEHRLSGEIGKSGCIIPTNAGYKEYILASLREYLSKMLFSIR